MEIPTSPDSCLHLAAWGAAMQTPPAPKPPCDSPLLFSIDEIPSLKDKHHPLPPGSLPSRYAINRFRRTLLSLHKENCSTYLNSIQSFGSNLHTYINK